MAALLTNTPLDPTTAPRGRFSSSHLVARRRLRRFANHARHRLRPESHVGNVSLGLRLWEELEFAPTMHTRPYVRHESPLTHEIPIGVALDRFSRMNY